MTQGSILHTHNLNLRPEAQPANNRKFLHVAWKCVIDVDRPFSNGGQLMCHEVFIYVEDIIGSTWVSDTPASNFVSGITAPLRGLIM
jgi:hypothetical protein